MSNILDFVKDLLRKANKGMGIHYVRIPVEKLRKIEAALIRKNDEEWCFDLSKAPKQKSWNEDYIPIQGLYPNDEFSQVWTVFQDFEGRWFGDHHSSTTGTDKEEPFAWRPIPEIKKTTHMENCTVSGGEGRLVRVNTPALIVEGDEVVISKQSLKDLLFLSRHYETRGIYDREAKDKFAAAVAEAKGKLGDHGDTNAG